jgi:CBS-domain-containing membrane protein
MVSVIDPNGRTLGFIDRSRYFFLVPTFADRGCHMVSVTDPNGSILGFLDRSRYFSIK